MRAQVKTKIESASEEHVNLSEMDIGDDEIEEIAEFIVSQKPRIKTLVLSKNKISDKGAIALAKVLSSLSQLSSLNLQFNYIDKLGAASIVALKQKFPKIRLALHGNYIVDTGVMQDIENEVLSKTKPL